MNNKLYGIGVGPGDSELLTIKGKRVMNESDVLFCPVKKEGAQSFAFEIIKEHLESDIEIIDLVYPMHYAEDELEKKWIENAAIISSILASGKTASFITLGDPTVYSTFMYTLPFIDSDVLNLEIIPGITSFCAVASEVKQPLILWEESLKIVPVRKNDKDQLTSAIHNNDNVVLMKPSNNPQAIIDMLEENNLQDKFMLISKVGTKDEVLVKDIEVLKTIKLPYLSTMVIKKGGFYE